MIPIYNCSIIYYEKYMLPISICSSSTYLVCDMCWPLGFRSNSRNTSSSAQDLHSTLFIGHVSQGEGDDDEGTVDEDSVGEVLRHRHRVPVMELEKTNTRLDWYGNIATAKQ